MEILIIYRVNFFSLSSRVVVLERKKQLAFVYAQTSIYIMVYVFVSAMPINKVVRISVSREAAAEKHSLWTPKLHLFSPSSFQAINLVFTWLQKAANLACDGIGFN